MEGIEKENISICDGSNQSVESSFLALEEILDLKNIVKDKSTAWRQQSLIIKSLNDTISDSLMERHWSCHDVFVDNNVTLDNVKFPDSDIKFPDIDKIYLANNSIEDHEMFDNSVFGDNYQSMHAIHNSTEHDTNTKVNNESLCRSRKIVENFLQHQTTKGLQTSFCSARDLLVQQKSKKNIENCGTTEEQNLFGNNKQKQDVGFNFAATKKSLGYLGRVSNSTRKNFVSPVPSKSTTQKDPEPINSEKPDDEVIQLLSHPALKNIDCKMVEFINNEIIHKFKPVDWNDIAGLDYAKSIIKEAVVYPLLRPDIFTGLRSPPRGILLFGPPGTGKTLIGKCIASQSCSTFFSISSSSLTSKWMGDGEKMVRALFAVAVARQPSVIFIDEIDSLLSQRCENENEGTRRLKTEFLVRLDGVATSNDDRVLIVGATNRPQELDEAVRRRFVKRLYVPLPEEDARAKILLNLLQTVENNLSLNDVKEISQLTDGYSGADMDSLCREASMEPLRTLPAESIITFNKEHLRPVSKNDFHTALRKIRPSVSPNDLNQYVEWNKTYGSSC